MNIRRLLLLLLLSAVPTRAQLPIPPVSFSTGGNITGANAACNVNNCVLLSLPSTAAVLTVGVTNTYSATLKPEESQDNGRTWTSAGADITSTGTTSYVVAGFSNFRVRGNAYTSGNAGVNMLASVAPSGGVTSGTTDPTGLPCAPNSLYVRTTNGFIYSCSGGTFTLSGGGGGTLTGNGTAGFLSEWTAGTVLGNSLCDEAITTANTLTCTDTAGEAVVSVQTGASPPTITAGTGGLVGLGEGTAPTSPAGADTAYGNAANHCLSVINNNVDQGCFLTTVGGMLFSSLTSSTNTTAAMVVGTGASLNFSGSGTINASTLGGATFAAPGAIGGTTRSAGSFSALNCGVLNTTACVLTGNGSTSGTAILTWPAVAGTTTNPIVSANVINMPELNLTANQCSTPTANFNFCVNGGNGLSLFSTGGNSTIPLVIYTNTQVGRTTAAGPITMVASGGQSYRFSGNINCTTTSAAATASLVLGWTDTGSQAQTLTVTVTCTALGASSVADMVHLIRAKSGTNVTWSISIVNTPTVDADLRLENL